jgi:hypothetical protein
MEPGTGRAVILPKPLLLCHKTALWTASVIVGGAGIGWGRA